MGWDSSDLDTLLTEFCNSAELEISHSSTATGTNYNGAYYAATATTDEAVLGLVYNPEKDKLTFKIFFDDYTEYPQYEFGYCTGVDVDEWKLVEDFNEAYQNSGV